MLPGGLDIERAIIGAAHIRPTIGRSGKRTASDDRPQVRPIGTLTESAAKQKPFKVAHVTAVNLSCVSTRTAAVEMQRTLTLPTTSLTSGVM